MGFTLLPPAVRITPSDARESPAAAAVFVLALAVAAFALLFGGEDFGAPTGSTLWWLGVGGAVVAVAVTLAWQLRST